MAALDKLTSLHWDPVAMRVRVIDQTELPHRLQWQTLDTLQSFCHAINSMQVRGAPLIGITAAFGLALELARDASDENLEAASAVLLQTRPTAVNLRWALRQVSRAVVGLAPGERAAAALARAIALRQQDIEHCGRIGEHGLQLLRGLPRDGALNIMTHCNAGWLATIEWGTALAPVYQAQQAGLPVHVWVSETRPRNQGASLTAWELQRAGVPCTLVADNSCGQLLRSGAVDCVLVGSDRTAANGDVCNKVGTYLKALAAHASGVPFYVALPASTVDWSCAHGDLIPIEERCGDELLTISGVDSELRQGTLRVAPAGCRAANPAFDITPASLVSALVTEQGVYEASERGLADLRRQIDSSGPM